MDEQNIIKQFCPICGHEQNDSGQCLRPFAEGGVNCRESIYYQTED